MDTLIQTLLPYFASRELAERATQVLAVRVGLKELTNRVAVTRAVAPEQRSGPGDQRTQQKRKTSPTIVAHDADTDDDAGAAAAKRPKINSSGYTTVAGQRQYLQEQTGLNTNVQGVQLPIDVVVDFEQSLEAVLREAGLNAQEVATNHYVRPLCLDHVSIPVGRGELEICEQAAFATALMDFPLGATTMAYMLGEKFVPAVFESPYAAQNDYRVSNMIGDGFARLCDEIYQERRAIQESASPGNFVARHAAVTASLSEVSVSPLATWCRFITRVETVPTLVALTALAKAAKSVLLSLIEPVHNTRVSSSSLELRRVLTYSTVYPLVAQYMQQLGTAQAELFLHMRDYQTGAHVLGGHGGGSTAIIDHAFFANRGVAYARSGQFRSQVTKYAYAGDDSRKPAPFWKGGFVRHTPRLLSQWLEQQPVWALLLCSSLTRATFANFDAYWPSEIGARRRARMDAAQEAQSDENFYVDVHAGKAPTCSTLVAAVCAAATVSLPTQAELIITDGYGRDTLGAWSAWARPRLLDVGEETEEEVEDDTKHVVPWLVEKFTEEPGFIGPVEWFGCSFMCIMQGVLSFLEAANTYGAVATSAAFEFANLLETRLFKSQWSTSAGTAWNVIEQTQVSPEMVFSPVWQMLNLANLVVGGAPTRQTPISFDNPETVKATTDWWLTRSPSWILENVGDAVVCAVQTFCGVEFQLPPGAETAHSGLLRHFNRVIVSDARLLTAWKRLIQGQDYLRPYQCLLTSARREFLPCGRAAREYIPVVLDTAASYAARFGGDGLPVWLAGRSPNAYSYVAFQCEGYEAIVCAPQKAGNPSDLLPLGLESYEGVVVSVHKRPDFVKSPRIPRLFVQENTVTRTVLGLVLPIHDAISQALSYIENTPYLAQSHVAVFLDTDPYITTLEAIKAVRGWSIMTERTRRGLGVLFAVYTVFHLSLACYHGAYPVISWQGKVPSNSTTAQQLSRLTSMIARDAKLEYATLYYLLRYNDNSYDRLPLITDLKELAAPHFIRPVARAGADDFSYAQSAADSHARAVENATRGVMRHLQNRKDLTRGVQLGSVEASQTPIALRVAKSGHPVGKLRIELADVADVPSEIGLALSVNDNVFEITANVRAVNFDSNTTARVAQAVIYEVLQMFAVSQQSPLSPFYPSAYERVSFTYRGSKTPAALSGALNILRVCVSDGLFFPDRDALFMALRFLNPAAAAATTSYVASRLTRLATSVANLQQPRFAPSISGSVQTVTPTKQTLFQMLDLAIHEGSFTIHRYSDWRLRRGNTLSPANASQFYLWERYFDPRVLISQSDRVLPEMTLYNQKMTVLSAAQIELPDDAFTEDPIGRFVAQTAARPERSTRFMLPAADARTHRAQELVPVSRYAAAPFGTAAYNSGFSLGTYSGTFYYWEPASNVFLATRQQRVPRFYTKFHAVVWFGSLKTVSALEPYVTDQARERALNYAKHTDEAYREALVFRAGTERLRLLGSLDNYERVARELDSGEPMSSKVLELLWNGTSAFMCGSPVYKLSKPIEQEQEQSSPTFDPPSSSSSFLPIGPFTINDVATADADSDFTFAKLKLSVLYAEEDVFDQLLANCFGDVGVGTVMFTHMIGQTRLVTEVLDCRPRAVSYDSLVRVV